MTHIQKKVLKTTEKKVRLILLPLTKVGLVMKKNMVLGNSLKKQLLMTSFIEYLGQILYNYLKKKRMCYFSHPLTVC